MFVLLCLFTKLELAVFFPAFSHVTFHWAEFTLRGLLGSLQGTRRSAIDFCHAAAILTREFKKALFLHGYPRSENEASRANTKLF